MSWGDAKPGGSYESVTALAVLSLVLSLTALLLPFAPAMLPPVGVVLLAALLLLPFAVAAAVTFAHWCWWRCARDSSIRGFGWALAAMIASHAVGAGWAIVVAAALLGPGGALLAGFTALMSFAAIAIAMRSAAAKYGLAASLLLAVTLGFLVCCVGTLREEARDNEVLARLRSLGVELAVQERYDTRDE